MSEVEQLTQQLRDEDLAVQVAAAERLAQLGEEAQPAAVDLVESLAREHDELSEWSVAALEQLGPPCDDDLAALARLLPGDNELVGYWASTLLGRAGQAAQGVVADLAGTLESSPYPAVQQRAAWALGKIGVSDSQVVQGLQKAAASSDARLARLAQQALEGAANR